MRDGEEKRSWFVWAGSFSFSPRFWLMFCYRISCGSSTKPRSTPPGWATRRFFFETWSKYRSQAPLEGLERTAIEIILLHPEHHGLLDDAQRNLERDFAQESSAVNAFLHLSLHLAIAEQLSIDQPRGISAAYRELAGRAASEHDALHILLECLGEVVWRAQRDRAAPDEAAYLECIRHGLG